MSTEATLVLHRLTCLAESDGTPHSEPYLWPVLLRVDDATLATAQLVSTIAPTVSNARIVLRQDMRAGQTVDVPPRVGVLRTRYADGQTTRKAILVVALWENDETPERAVRAGYQAFVAEVGTAVAENLLALNAASDAERDVIIASIQGRVEQRVRAAIRGALSAFEKAQVAIGTLNLDDILGSDFHLFDDLVASSFTMRFGEGSDNDFRLSGELQVHQVIVDPCQAKIDAVTAAQRAIDAVQAEIADLQAQLHGGGGHGEPPLPKAAIIAEIKRIRTEELPPLVAALNAAKAALKACRDQRTHIDPTDVVVIGGARQ